MLSYTSPGPYVLVFAIFLPRHEVGIGQGDYFSGIRYICIYRGKVFWARAGACSREGGCTSVLFCFFFIKSGPSQTAQIRVSGVAARARQLWSEPSRQSAPVTQIFPHLKLYFLKARPDLIPAWPWPGMGQIHPLAIRLGLWRPNSIMQKLFLLRQGQTWSCLRQPNLTAPPIRSQI